MKKPFYCLLLLASVCMLASCSSTTKSTKSIDRDAMSRFFARESLTIQDYNIRTNECGYEFNFMLTDKSDSNRVFQGWLGLSDMEKINKESEQRSVLNKEEDEKAKREIAYGTNQFANIVTYDKEGLGILIEARPLLSERVTERFPGCQIFIVGCLGRGLNPSYVAQPLVVTTNQSPAHLPNIFILRNAPTVTTFMNLYKQPIRNRDEARETLDLLCELQSWTLCDSIPAHLRQGKDAEKTEWLSRWRYTETATATGWNFKAVFLTDPRIECCNYYEVDVLHDGTITIKDQQYMGQSGGYI
jgi:hypothetical protein